jgi:RNase P subunit RPR2
MKPKTELQKQIVKLSGKLPALTEKQRRWGIMNAMDHVGLRLKKGLITCTHCGKIFYDLMKLEDGEMDICPNCGTHLKIETTTRKSCRDNEYFNIITTCHGFQVFRYFYIRKEFHSGKEASYCIREVVQNWMSADGKFKTMALLANMHSCMVSWHRP